MSENLNLNKKIFSNKGITLIALIITIIVLLILAGVSIASITGDNGVLNKANKARVETDKATVLEQIQLAVIASYGTDGQINTTKLEKELKNYFGNDVSIEKGTNGILPWTVTENGYKFEITATGRVKKVTAQPEEPDEPETPEITLSATTGEVEVEDTLVLTATLNVTGDITWSTSDATKATVVGSGDNNLTGTVTGISAGTVTITATYGEASKTCEVTVKAKEVTSNLTDEEKAALTTNGIAELTESEILALPNGSDLLNSKNVKAVLTGGVVIPTDFTYKEGNKKDGAVLVNDKDGSEFVWVPVDTPSSMYGTDANGKKMGKTIQI